VLQFKQEFFDDLKVLEKLEDQFENFLLDAEIDGHDIGNEECNIFIHTDIPLKIFDKVKAILHNQKIDIAEIKAGYRDFASNTYIPIWPEDLKEFKVLSHKNFQ